MNPDLDRLFEQARNNLRAEMPIEAVEKLIQHPASTSFWKRNKYKIMGTSFFISILTVISLSFWNSTPSTSIDKKIIINDLVTIETPHITAPNDLDSAIKNPETVFHFTENSPKNLRHWQDNQLTDAKVQATLDSLIPKEVFREYRLTIKNDNSEQDIKKLKTELKNYGIYLEISRLDYNDKNRIKNFSGQFTTDSLFCDNETQNHSFNISGAFDDIVFTFRVAKDKNLKYLKIESDNFEETIQCYDDEVITDISSAKKHNEFIQKDLSRLREEIEMKKLEIEHAMQDIDEHVNSTFKLHFNELLNHRLNELRFKFEYKDHLSELKKQDGIKLGEDLNIELKELLKDLDVDIQDLKEELNIEVLKDLELENKIRVEIAKEQEKNNLDRSAKDLKEAAKELKRAYKEVRKEAKRMAREEKKHRR